jgi:hypothetical protein
LGALAALATLRPDPVAQRILSKPDFRNQLQKIKQTENEKAIEFAKQLSSAHKGMVVLRNECGTLL